MDLVLVKKIFENLYHDVNGYNILINARKKVFNTDKALIYGEVTPESFFRILQEVTPKEGEVFCDLGSGTGRAVILAGLLFGFSQAVGIEILKELHLTAERVLGRFNLEIKPTLPADKKETTYKFINADFLEYDFFDGDVIFVHSTCFYPELITALSGRLDNLRTGSRIITVTQAINNNRLILKKIHQYPMGWGEATVYFYEKN